ncbi:MAG TPA: penicillin acylase family protein [Bryobacteraceae bacterium]|nr:penicillin acylase family protein [Bryobacteraceae bacterium]
MRTLLCTLLAAGCAAAASPEILWDKYGVPHIFAPDRESMFYAHGWAQAQAQGNLLLLLYGQSRGRAAEYWGPEHAALDRWVRVNEVPERAKTWYDAQDPVFRKYVDEFARGINDYTKAHPDTIGAQYRVVLPVSGVDVIGHSLRAVHYMYMGSMERMRREVNAAVRSQELARTVLPEIPEITPGSNTWAIGPPRSASGKSMLVINPHLAWGDTFYRYMEVHLVGPGYDFYGAPQIGFPTPVIGFNRRTGWGRTVNTIDTVDFYRLTVKGDQYEFDGKLRPFERATKTMKIKQADGSFQEEKIEVLRSVHGPVVYSEKGMVVAMRVAGLDRPKMLEQWFRMGEARNLTEFQNALKMMAVPMWNANYADADGHILQVYDGLVPKRSTGDVKYWAGVVPGDTSKTLWTEYLSYDELPKSLDPPSGFNQNVNEPPWFMTMPMLDASKYPAYLSPPDIGPSLYRAKRSYRMLTEMPKISYQQMTADKLSTRVEMADAVLPDLIQAAAGTEAAGVLSKWDRMTDVSSRGAVLFKMFTDKYRVEDHLRVRFDPLHPVDSAYGLADPAGAASALAAAAEECKKTYGSLDVAWGDVNRYGSGNADLPGDGGSARLGIFRTIAFERKVGNKNYASHGETFVCTIEFAEKQNAQCSLSYGNFSQPGSKHLEDQLPLMVEKKLHPVWRERKEIEANLEKREKF